MKFCLYITYMQTHFIIMPRENIASLLANAHLLKIEKSPTCSAQLNYSDIIIMERGEIYSVEQDNLDQITFL